MNIDKEISKAHLSATGWRLNDHFSGNPIETHACFYIIDTMSDKIAMATASKEAFDSIPVNNTAESFASNIRESFRKNSDSLSPDICDPLVGYIKATQVYQLWLKQHPGERMHVVLLMYHSVMRPAIIPWHSTVVDPDSLQLIVARIMAADKQRHPELFN